MLRAVRHRLPEAGFRLTYCHNATLGRRDFYRHVCMSLGPETRATAAAVFYTIASHESAEGKLRDIDRIATAALKVGARRKLRQIDRGVIASIASEEPDIE